MADSAKPRPAWLTPVITIVSLAVGAIAAMYGIDVPAPECPECPACEQCPDPVPCPACPEPAAPAAGDEGEPSMPG